MQPERNEYYEQKTLFITGFAGSGKSTEITNIADSKTLVLVPTHKAADVLIAKGIENVYTIHAVLKLVPSINENFKRKMTTKLKQVGATDLSKITKVVIDEFSMINEEILNTLMDTLPDKADVYIVGDPYQLPPVTGDPIQPWEPIIELNTQYRSKNMQGTIMFMNFMDAIQNYKKSPHIREADNPVEDWVPMFDPKQDRVLAFTNKRVAELNKMISGNDTYYYGDELLMNGLPATMVHSDYNPRLYPSCISKGRLLPEDKLAKASMKATADIIKWNTKLGMYKQTSVTIDEKDYLIYYDPNHYETEKRLKKDVEKYQRLVISENKLSLTENIPQWCKENRGAPYVRERGKAWSKFLAHTGYVFNLAYPYATTVHKAQGSEFRRIFIDQEDIAKALSTEQYQRLMYVALSRGIEDIIFI